MEKKLIKLHYKSYYIFLLVLTVIVFAGIWSTPNFIRDAGYLKNINTYAIILIFLKSSCVFWISEKFTEKMNLSFLIAFLYLVSPMHIGSFVFNYQLQAAAAELGLLLSIIFYLKQKDWLSFVFLSASMILCTPFLAFGIIVFFIKGLDRKFKHLFIVQALITLILIFPKHNGKEIFYINNFKNVAHHFGQMFLPANVDFLNMAVLDPAYLSLPVFLMIGLVLFGSLFILNRNPKKYYWYLILLITIVSSFIPYFVIENNNNFVFFNSPILMPSVLLLFFLLIYEIFRRMNFSRTSYGLAILFAAIWLAGNLNQQFRFKSPETLWEESMMSLPENINYEEDLKLKYARFLLLYKRMDKAEAFIEVAAEKFRKEKWYALLITIASQKKDSKRIQQLQKVLDDKKVPFSDIPEKN